MRYKYENHLYDAKINGILILSGVILVALNINTQRNIKVLGIAAGIFGLVAALIIKASANYRGNFQFIVQDKSLKVLYKGKVINFDWADMENVVEDEHGLVIKLNRDNIEFPVLNDMEGYDNFKKQVIKKAYEFSFPIKIITDEGRG